MTLMGLWCLGKWCTIQRKRWLFYELTGQTSSKKRSTTSTIFKIFGATVVCNIDSMKYIFCHSKTNWHLIHAQKDIFLFRRIRLLTESYARIKIKHVESHLLFFNFMCSKGGLISEGIFSLVSAASSSKLCKITIP